MKGKTAAKGGAGSARPIRTRRDHSGAAAAAKRLGDQAARDSAAEARLKSLLHELEKFDAEDADPGDVSADTYADASFARRWSDERTDGE